MKLDVKAAAARTGLSVKTLDNWRSLGVGPPYYKLGGRVLYDADELDAWLASHRRPGTSSAQPALVGPIATFDSAGSITAPPRKPR